MVVIDERTERRPRLDGRRERHETVIIGGGQAGLATAYHLAKRGRESVVLEAHERVGDSWRTRWPSLRLYSAAVNDGLPGMRFPAPRLSYPSGLEMADYLEAYAERFELPVRTGCTVDALEREGDGYVVTAGDRRIEADNVVIASGVFADPYTPDFASELDAEIVQIHSFDYRSPAQLKPGAVLVVGAAHSGADIAFEAANAGHETLLSGRDTGQLPFRVDSRVAQVANPLMRFVAQHVLTMRTPMGRKVQKKIRSGGGPLLRIRSGELEEAGVERVFERTVGVVGGQPALADGRVLDVANVVWCTGFKNRYGWIRFPFPIGEDGFPEQKNGAVPGCPGLYFAGLLFQSSFASMLILGAGKDAERVARHIAKHRSPTLAA